MLLFSSLGAAALIGTAVPVSHVFFAPPVAGTAATAIAGFAPGLLGYGLYALLSRALYARGETRAATVAIAVGFLAVPATALILGALLPLRDRVLAVALANSAGMVLLGGLLLVAVWRSAGRPALAGAGRAGAAGLLAGALAALAGTALARWLDAAAGGTPTTPGALVQGMLSGALVGVVFLAVVWLVDRRDVTPLLAGVLRRLGRAGRRGPAAPADGTGEGDIPPERGGGKETVSR